MRGREGLGLRSKEIALAGVVLALSLAIYFLVAISDLPVPYLILILFYPVISRWIKGLLSLVTFSYMIRYIIIVTEFYRANNDAMTPLLNLADPVAAHWIYEILASPFMAYYFLGLFMILLFVESGQAVMLALGKVGYYRRLEALREALNF